MSANVTLAAQSILAAQGNNKAKAVIIAKQCQVRFSPGSAEQLYWDEVAKAISDQ